MADFKIITPSSNIQSPNPLEICVAEIVAQLFQSDIYFVDPGEQRSPDLYVKRTHTTWEIKNIRGNSKRTIANNLRCAKYQSSNIIISLLATKMTPIQAKSRVLEYLKSGPTNIKHIIIITKSKKIIAIK